MRLHEFTTRKGIYRSRNGVFLGVCRGLAEYFDFSVAWVRILTLVALLFTGFFPVGLTYLILGLVLKPAPVIRPSSDAEEEFYHSYTDSRRMAINRLQRTYQSMERRLRRIEDSVTSRDFNWESRVRE